MNRIILYMIVVLVFASCKDEPASIDQTQTSSVTITGTLPVMYIETGNRTPITSKTVYLDARYWIVSSGSNATESLGSESSPLTMQIRGRGHSSWEADKKPYKLKLGSKTALLGMAKNKHWALIKPSESSVAGFQMGKIMNMDWTPSFRPVEVVLNGEYIGLYFLTETIRIDENRVNIYEQKDQETEPKLVEGGWLVEVDNYIDDCQITIPENKTWNLTLKYHSPEDLSDVQLTWLTNEFNDINTAIYSEDKSSTMWEYYFDIESLARYFILQEVMDNPYGFHGSFYLHKDLGNNTKWVAGPVWDILCYNREKTDYTFKMKADYYFTPHWIGEIIQYESFCKAVETVWNEVYPNKLSEIYDYIDSVMLPLDKAWKNDCIKWAEDTTQTAQLRADKIKTALSRNIDWFNNNLPKCSTDSVQ